MQGYQRKERKIMNKFMKIAKERSISGCRNHEGGHIGAVIVDKEGNVIESWMSATEAHVFEQKLIA